MSQILAYCDGACRGNPGPASCAFAVYNGDELIHRSGFYLGDKCTNNEAEFAALLSLLTYISGATRVLIYCDSALVVNTINGNWKLKAPNLLAMRDKAYFLLCRGMHILVLCKGHSEIIGNQECDRLCNEILDEKEAEDKNQEYLDRGIEEWDI